MAVPHINPNKMAKPTANALPLKTKYMAYPPESEANKAVKNMVAPMPTYLLCSTGYFFKVSTCAPEQNQKKRVTFLIYSSCYLLLNACGQVLLQRLLQNKACFGMMEFV